MNDHRLRVFYSQKQFIDKANNDYAALRLKRDGVVISENPFTLNGFADLTSEEFTAKYTGEAQETAEQAEVAPEVEYTESADAGLAQAGYEIRVRNQGSCGSCWAFSAVATYEKFWFLKTGQRLDLSQQQLVDCDTTDNGCNGGLSWNALGFINGKGLALASAYPYTATKGACTQTYAAERIGAGQLISVSLYASGKFRYLDSSTTPFNAADAAECSMGKNHAINAVDAKSGSLRLLNSWGTNWADKGLRWVTPCSESNLWAQTSWVTSPQ